MQGGRCPQPFGLNSHALSKLNIQKPESRQGKARPIAAECKKILIEIAALRFLIKHLQLSNLS